MRLKLCDSYATKSVSCKNAWNSIHLYVAVRNALFMEVLDVANHLPERDTHCEQVRSLLKCDDSEVAAYP